MGSLRDHWHEHAEAWSLYARAPGHDRAHEELNLPSFLTLLPPTPARVLDLGCGEGRVGAVLVERGYDVVGVDSSETMAALARERHEAVCADAADLPFDGGSFDIVTSYMSLFNMDDMPGAVAEAARVLRPGGHFCVSVLHPFLTAGEVDEDGRFVVTRSYFEQSTKVWSKSGDGIDMTFHDRRIPLGDYTGALEGAGLLIERVREVRSDSDLVPLFLQFRALAPAANTRS